MTRPSHRPAIVAAMRSALSTLALALVLTSCGSAAPSMESRFVAVHNAMTSAGFAQTGSISEGSLDIAAPESRVTMDLVQGQCYVFMAFGSEDISNIDVFVVDESGAEIARDQTLDRQAATQACAERTGPHQIVVTASEGFGDFTVTAWSGVAPTTGGGSAIASAGTGAAGTCGNPIALTPGTPLSGDTGDSTSASLTGACANNTAPEDVYLLNVTQRATYDITVQSRFDATLYVQQACGDQSSELACNDDDPDTTRSHVSVRLDPGQYYVIVDGYGENSGAYDLIVSESTAQTSAQLCTGAQTLPLGQSVSGTTSGDDNFQSSCASRSQSPETIYQVTVPTRSRLRVRQQTPSHDGSLHIRRTCADESSELACNDDFQGTQASLLRTVVDPGTYFIFSDGYGSNNQGTHTIRADAAPVTGGAVPNDRCQGAGPAPSGSFDIDTIGASDDTAGTCGGGGAPDVIYPITITQRSRVQVTLTNSEFEGVAYIQSTCGDQSSEVVCQAFSAGRGQSNLDANLQPGTYFLVLDGRDGQQFGAGSVSVTQTNVASLQSTCNNSPRLRPGTTVQGTLQGASNDFRGRCSATMGSGNSSASDLVYQLRLTRASRVRLTLNAQGPASMYVRGDCADENTEVACQGSIRPGPPIVIDQRLGRGTHYVIVDSPPGANTNFSLDVAVTRN